MMKKCSKVINSQGKRCELSNANASDRSHRSVLNVFMSFCHQSRPQGVCVGKLVCQSVSQSASQSVSQSVTQSVSHSDSQSVSKSGIQLVSRSFSQSVS